MDATVDADAVVCEVSIDATPQTLFEFLTDPDKLVRWMGESAKIDPQPGGVYAVDINPNVLMRGEYVEVVSNERVVFTFGWDSSPIAPGSTKVTIELLPKDSRSTIVRLTHTGLPEPARDQHADGWNHYLQRLSVAAVGGDPGPDKNAM